MRQRSRAIAAFVICVDTHINTKTPFPSSFTWILEQMIAFFARAQTFTWISRCCLLLPSASFSVSVSRSIVVYSRFHFDSNGKHRIIFHKANGNAEAIFAVLTDLAWMAPIVSYIFSDELERRLYVDANWFKVDDKNTMLPMNVLYTPKNVQPLFR